MTTKSYRSISVQQFTSLDRITLGSEGPMRIPTDYSDSSSPKTETLVPSLKKSLTEQYNSSILDLVSDITSKLQRNYSRKDLVLRFEC